MCNISSSIRDENELLIICTAILQSSGECLSFSNSQFNCTHNTTSPKQIGSCLPQTSFFSYFLFPLNSIVSYVFHDSYVPLFSVKLITVPISFFNTCRDTLCRDKFFSQFLFVHMFPWLKSDALFYCLVQMIL